MLRTLLLSTALVTTTVAAAPAPDEPKPEPKANDKAGIEVYRLKNADPNDALEAFNSLTGQPNRLGPAPGGRQPGPRGPGGGGPGRRGGTVDPTDPFDTAPAPAAPKPVVARALVDARTRSLVVRGVAQDLQLAADLVAVLDTPEGKPLPAVKTVKAFRLEHIDATDLAAMLQALDPQMSYRMAPVGRMKLLLATGTDEQMKELADAVKKLDIPTETK